MKKNAVVFLTVCLVACMAISGAWASEVTGSPSMAGTWTGTVAAMNLDITFTLDTEGKGTYCFTQYGSTLEGAIAVDAENRSWSVEIAEGNRLGIVSCAGGYMFTGESIILSAQSVLADNSTLPFIVQCVRVPGEAEEATIVGSWTGSVPEMGLEMTFTLDAEGNGAYCFTQFGQTLDGAITFDETAKTWSVEIAEGNRLGIVSCEGTYAFLGDTIELSAQSLLADNSVLPFAVLCTRIPEETESTIVGKWAGAAHEIGLEVSFEMHADGNGTYEFKQYSSRMQGAITINEESQTWSIEVAEGNHLGIMSCTGSYTFTGDTVVLRAQSLLVDNSVFPFSVECTRAE